MEAIREEEMKLLWGIGRPHLPKISTQSDHPFIKRPFSHWTTLPVLLDGPYIINSSHTLACVM